MNILLTAVGTTGDVIPLAALAVRLQERGHTVRVCSFSLHARHFTDRGLDFLPLRTDVTWEEIHEVARRAAGQSPLEQFELLQEFHLRAAKEHYEACREAAVGFDLAVCHVFHTLGQAAVESHHMPWVGVTVDPTLLPTALAPPPGMRGLGRFGNRFLWWVVGRSLERFDTRLSHVLSEVGYRGSKLRMFRTVSRRLNLVAASPVLSPPREDWPQTVETTGAWFEADSGAQLDDDLEGFLEEHPEPTVVTLGSFVAAEPTGVSRVLMEAIERSGTSAVIQRGTVPFELDGSPPGVLFVDWVPYDVLFRRAGVVIHHAGAGTSHAACRAGTPSVTIPQLGDQFFWAHRLEDLDVAPQPIPLGRLSARRLAAAIVEARSGPMRRAAEVLGSMIGSEDGLGRAVSKIERLGGSL